MSKYNILLLANNRHITGAVIDHIQAITSSTEHQWFIENPLICKTLHKIDLTIFDAIGFHYSIRPHDPYYVPNALYRKIKAYQGTKFQFIQDEYKHVNLTKHTILDLGIQLLFTLVKPSLIETAYPTSELPNTKKITILTGYTPKHLESIESPLIKDRPIDIFYRSRHYDFWLGKLSQERNIIAKETILRSQKYGLSTDISLSEHERVYGADWYNKHRQSKAVLATESGASIWDYTGQIEKEVKRLLRNEPHLNFDDVYEKVLVKYEGNIMYNACSPRLFEAIALRTALVMFPGEYSNVCKPDKHYIPLEKDFSNFHDVVKKLNDIDYLQSLVNFAHQDIIASGRFAQSELTNLVNHEIKLSLKDRFKNSDLHPICPEKISNTIKENTSKNLLLNTFYISLSELIFSIQNIILILRDPRYTLQQKCSRLIKGINRYFTYIIPRFKQ